MDNFETPKFHRQSIFQSLRHTSAAATFWIKKPNTNQGTNTHTHTDYKQQNKDKIAETI